MEITQTIIPLPSKIEINEDKENKNEAEIIIEPCYPGYGVTLGNALRRVLLSSLPGAAVIAAKLKGASHEFSTLPNVKEDILEIILNLKMLRVQFEVSSQEPIALSLKVSGEKVVKAKDIETVAGIKIINPDLKIATLTDSKAVLDMKIWVAQGKGYLTSEEMKINRDFEVGAIVCDAIFTPVIKVGVDIENVRVGERTDYDKLILNIETDGSISPKESLEKAANILIDQFNFVAGKGLPKELEKASEEAKEEEVEEIKEVKEEKEAEKKEKTKRGRPKKD